MSTWAIALFLKPLVAVVVLGVPVYAIRSWLPPGLFKDILLLEVHDDRRYTLLRSIRALRDKHAFP